MIKKLTTVAAVFAFIGAVAPVFSAPASAATATKNFDVTATVASIATISFSTASAPTTEFSWGSTDFQQFNNNYKGADNNPGTIGGTFRTSNAGGAAVYFTAPVSITGTGNASNTLTVASVMQFTCSGGTYTPSGGGSAIDLTGGTSAQSAIATGASTNACATLPANASASALSIPLNLFLNGDTLPADTYTSSGGAFTITVSAT